MGLIEPTAGERRNGWTAETLTAYLAEREEAEAREYEAMLDRKVRPATAVKDWDPLRRTCNGTD